MASSEVPTHHGDDTLYQEESLSAPADDVFAQLQSTSSPTMSSTNNIPKPPPPPPPCITYQRFQASRTTLSNLSRIVPKETVETWDNLFREGLGADTYVETGSGDYISRLPAHSSVLAAASPVIAELLCQSTVKQGKIHLNISSVPLLPHEAVYMFIRFLYSSCYEEEEMKKYVLHLMIMSHTYSVPSLKRVCVEVLEQGWINKDNVIDVLQIAKDCDATRICFLCVSMVIKDFEAVSVTDGWIVMRITHRLLEQQLINAVLEADTRKQERETKLKERKVYLELYETMEALVHICRDGCRTIGPRDKPLKGSQTVCKFAACNWLEGVLRHFLGCTSRASCPDCKRVWQLLQLHSCLCDDSDSCKVPLCQNFKVKMKKVSKREESKWRLLVEKIIRAKNSLGPFSSRLI